MLLESLDRNFPGYVKVALVMHRASAYRDILYYLYSLFIQMDWDSDTPRWVEEVMQ